MLQHFGAGKLSGHNSWINGTECAESTTHTDVDDIGRLTSASNRHRIHRIGFARIQSTSRDRPWRVAAGRGWMLSPVVLKTARMPAVESAGTLLTASLIDPDQWVMGCKRYDQNLPSIQRRGVDLADRGRRGRRGARNCSPYCRTIAAAGSRRIPTAPRSSMKVHSAAIRLTTSSGVNIAAIPSPLPLDAAVASLRLRVHFLVA